MAWYKSGSVSVTNGSASVVGGDTLWATQAAAGDLFTLDGAKFYEVLSVTDNTHLTLASAYAGTTLSAQAYAIIRNFTSTTNAQLALNLADMINKWHLSLDELLTWLTSLGSVSLTNPATGSSVSVKTPSQIQAEWIGALSKAITTADVALTTTEASNAFIKATGALTGNRSMTVPAAQGHLIAFENATTGAYTLTFKTPAGTGVVVGQGERALLFCNGTNVVNAFTSAPGINAADVGITPAGNIAATTVQAAINELDAEKAKLAGDAAQDFTVNNLTISAAISDNDSDTSGATTAFVQSQIANNNNPTAIAQSINLTAAASGSNGIQVADNANIDLGTGNFTLHWEGSLPGWTPGAAVLFISKIQSADIQWYFQVTGTGFLQVVISRNTTYTLYISTVANSFIDGTAHKVSAVVVRETASADGSVTFFADGVQLGAVVTIPYASTTNAGYNLDNTGALYILGTSTVRYAGRAKSAYTFNRALSASEVLDLCRNVVAFADKGAKQTTLNVSSMGAGTFDSSSGLSATGGTFTKSTAGTKGCGTADEILFVLGKTYIAEYDAEFTGNVTGAFLFLKSSVGGVNWSATASPAVNGHNVSVFVCITGGTGVVNFAVSDSIGTAGNLIISNLKVYAAGATLELTPEGIQPEPGQWLDSSGNKLHAKMPIEGATTTRRKKDFEVRWSNTWAGTHESQYLGGVNEAILPSDNIRIESITMRCSATGVNVILGDGSATARWVASVALATYLDCTIANRNHDGTNRKLVIKPSANYAGTITTTIIGRILD